MKKFRIFIFVTVLLSQLNYANGQALEATPSYKGYPEPMQAPSCIVYCQYRCGHDSEDILIQIREKYECKKGYSPLEILKSKCSKDQNGSYIYCEE